MVSAHSKQSLLKGILVVYLISFGAHCSALNCVDCGTKDAEVIYRHSSIYAVNLGTHKKTAEAKTA